LATRRVDNTSSRIEQVLRRSLETAPPIEGQSSPDVDTGNGSVGYVEELKSGALRVKVLGVVVTGR
jgi:hypothetical protein